MKIQSVELKNFRSFSEKKLNFTAECGNPRQFTVLIGDNSAGKTTVLEAVTKCFVPTMRSLSKTAVQNCDIKDSDIKYGTGWTVVSAQAEIDGKQFELLNKRRLKTSTEYDEKVDLKKQKKQASLIKDVFMKKCEENQLPLVLYYGTNRVFNEVPKRGHLRDYLIENALDSCFDNTNNFREFYEWFKKEEDIELRELRERNDYKNISLKAVRDAIARMMPGYQNLRIMLNPSRMVITNALGEELRIEQLSGGYKAILAVVSDIAKRLAMANPNNENPLEGEAIILIDELDLHLHPKWQKTIVEDLKRTFPNCQFIVSTHSPFIIQSLRQEELVDLEQDGVLSTEGTFEGWSIEEIQEHKMNVETKTERYNKILLEFTEAVDADQKQRVLSLYNELVSMLHPDSTERKIVDMDVRMVD